MAAQLLQKHPAGLHGQRVALYAAPSREFVAGLFGIMRAGGVVVVLSPLHPIEESRYFLADAGVVHIVHDAAMRTRSEALTGNLVAITDATVDHVELPLVRDEDPALQLYTSGTTSRPKGAVLSHRNLAVQQQLLGEAWGFTETDVLLHALPLHHMHGLCIALFTALGRGSTVRMRSFDAAQVWSDMRSATAFMGVPTMYAKLFEAFDRAPGEQQAQWAGNARNLRLATSGSAALPVPLAERWHALTGTIPLERFGMTEIGVGISNPLHGDRVAGSIGFALHSVETRVVDDQGGDTDVGQLWVRGPSVFVGYHNRDNSGTFANGWFPTGDTVSRDGAGRFRVLGRTSSDIFKTGGYKVSALEIEDVLRRHPGVRDAAVIGTPDPIWGDRLIACLVGDSLPKAATLKAFLAEHLASYKVPKQFVVVPALPRTPMGKVMKSELARQLADAIEL